MVTVVEQSPDAILREALTINGFDALPHKRYHLHEECERLYATFNKNAKGAKHFSSLERWKNLSVSLGSGLG